MATKPAPKAGDIYPTSDGYALVLDTESTDKLEGKTTCRVLDLPAGRVVFVADLQSGPEEAETAEGPTAG